jgi:hypothetical protein
MMYGTYFVLNFSVNLGIPDSTKTQLYQKLYLMKKTTLTVFALCMFIFSHAQNAKQSNAPNSGSFYVTQTTSKGKEQINVNYVLQNAPFINSVKLLLNTPDPMGMSVKLYDNGGTLVGTWVPQQAGSNYEHDFDISNLKPAKYRMDIYGQDNKKIHSISFVKQSSVNN